MRLGIGTYAFRWAVGTPTFPSPNPLTAGRFVRLVAELGAEVAQFAENLPLERLTPAELDELRRTADGLGVALEVGTAGCTPERLRRHLDIAQRLGSDLVRLVLHSGDCSPTPQQALEALREVLPRYERAGVSIAVENHFLLRSPALLELVRAAQSPALGVCLDTANSIACGEWPLETAKMLAPFALTVHLKDYAIRPDPDGAGLVISGAPLGEGQQDLPQLMRALALPASRNASLILEQWLPKSADPAALLRKELDWVQRGVAAARRLLQAAGARS